MDRTYTFETVVSNIYYDLVNLIGEDGLYAEIDLDFLVATIAAPITRLDFANTPSTRLKKIMKLVNLYMTKHHRWQNLTHDALVKRLMYDWIPTFNEEEMKDLVSEFRMIDGFNDEGFAIINAESFERYYNQKLRLDSEKVPYQIEYGPLTDVQGTAQGTRWPESKYDKTRLYHGFNDGGYWCVNHEITEDEWYRLLKEKISGKLRNVLMAYLDLDGHRGSPLNMEQWYGIAKFSVNACNITLGRRAKMRMNIEVQDSGGTFRCWSVAMNKGRGEGENGFVWEMRPELCRAVERISKEEGWTPISRI